MVVDLVLVSEEYVLVIFDVGLLWMDGFEVLVCLCGCGKILLVLMLIVCGEVKDWVYGFNFGVDDYLVKFFELFELEVWVKVLLCCSVFGGE